MEYNPQPIRTDHIQLHEEILDLAEKLAENTHDVWAKERMDQGWCWGPARSDEKKEHPCLIPYEDLPESEKVYDRKMKTMMMKTKETTIRRRTNADRKTV